MEFQGNMKCNNIQIIGIPEEEKEQGIEILFEKMTKKLSEPREGKNHVRSGNTESSNQDES